MKKMTLKQKKFADEYIISGNATQSAIKAGYSEKTARQLGTENLSKPYIRSYIDERLEKLESEKIAKQEEVLKYLTSVMRGETLSEVVVIEGRGDGYSSAMRMNKAPDEKEKLKAAELLGKRYSIFTDKMNIEGAVPVIIKDDIGDDEEDE